MFILCTNMWFLSEIHWSPWTWPCVTDVSICLCFWSKFRDETPQCSVQFHMLEAWCKYILLWHRIQVTACLALTWDYMGVNRWCRIIRPSCTPSIESISVRSRHLLWVIFICMQVQALWRSHLDSMLVKPCTDDKELTAIMWTLIAELTHVNMMNWCRSLTTMTLQRRSWCLPAWAPS